VRCITDMKEPYCNKCKSIVPPKRYADRHWGWLGCPKHYEVVFCITTDYEKAIVKEFVEGLAPGD
jgi:coenzyme F420-reducing hydrogenase beta subunit